MAEAMTRVLERLDGAPRRTLAHMGTPLYRLAMIALRRVSRAKTTGFGRRPVY